MRKKIVFLIGGLNFGGMERVVFIAKELLEKDYDITIVTLYQSGADYDVRKEYYNLDVPPSKKKLRTFLKRLIQTIKMKKKLQPDEVFSFGMYLNYLNVLSNFFFRKKIITIVGIRSYDWLIEPFFTKMSDRWIMRHAKKINSVSKLIAYDAEKIWGIPEKKNKVIYNPYNVKEIQKRSMEIVDDFSFDPANYYIITMGRLVDQKGYNHLVRAFDSVRKKYREMHLVIIGNGDRKQELEEMIKEYNLEEFVHLIGGKANPYKYVRRADVYVLSSITEGFPNALSEAMCIGIPVISVDCKSGPKEILFQDSIIHQNKVTGYCVGDYGILSQELVMDKQYKKRDLDAGEKALADAICYSYENRKEMDNLAEKAVRRMEQFNYGRFYKTMRDVLDDSLTEQDG